MNAPAKIEVPHFNAMAAYERERETNRRLWRHLSNVLMIAEAMAWEQEREGKDVSTRRAIIEKARAERWQA